MIQQASTVNVPQTTSSADAKDNEYLRKENELLKAQLLTQTSLLKDQSSQISELTAQVGQLNKKIDALSATHRDNIKPATLPKAFQTQSVNASNGNSGQTTESETASIAPAVVVTETNNGAGVKTVVTPVARPEHVLPSATTKPISWADIARIPSMKKLPSTMQSKFEKSIASLRKNGFTPSARPPPGRPNPAGGDPRPSTPPQPVPTPVYFGGVPRGPIGSLKRSLQECLPSWAVLSISFIGNSACEILCHKPLEQRLIAAMKLIGFRHLATYDPMRLATSEGTDAVSKKIKLACYRRWMWTAGKTFSPVSKNWYTNQAQAIIANNKSLKAQLEAEDAAQKEKKASSQAASAAAKAVALATVSVALDETSSKENSTNSNEVTASGDTGNPSTSGESPGGPNQ